MPVTRPTRTARAVGESPHRFARVAHVVHSDRTDIPTVDLSRIFDPFVQIGRKLSSQDGGTGLGLAISRDLARGMGGDLTAESVVEVGSSFTLTLPAASEAANPSYSER
jgi:signal transduction histidine kinase